MAGKKSSGRQSSSKKSASRGASRKSSTNRSSGRESASKKSSASRTTRASSSRGGVRKKSSSSGGKSSGRKYGKKAQQEVRTEMHHLKKGEHKNRKQAIAIGLSKARREGAKVPPRKKAA